MGKVSDLVEKERSSEPKCVATRMSHNKARQIISLEPFSFENISRVTVDEAESGILCDVTEECVFYRMNRSACSIA